MYCVCVFVCEVLLKCLYVYSAVQWQEIFVIKTPLLNPVYMTVFNSKIYNTKALCVK